MSGMSGMPATTVTRLSVISYNQGKRQEEETLPTSTKSEEGER